MEKTSYFSNMEQKDTLSYKLVNEETVIKEDKSNASIIGCKIQKSIFTEVSFYSADFDGTIMIDCKFEKGNWSRTDCCSLTASNTIFIGIDFTLSTMRNAEFKKCTFINCNFDHIALSGSTFYHCLFKDIVLSQSSTYLNTYINCCFDSCNFNGNFYYNMLIRNEYMSSFFHKKLFAYNYFFQENNKNLELFGLDNLQEEEVKTYLIQNNLLINLVILDLNENSNIDLSIIRFLAAIGELLNLGTLVREEQLQFIHNLSKFLLREDLLSAITIAEASSYIEHHLLFLDMQDNFAYEKCKETLNAIKNELLQAYQIMGQSISFKYDEKKEDTEQIVKIVYNKEPEIPICTILNEIKASLGINAPDAARIKTEVGSFHEWISCYDSVVQCLQLLISVLGLGYTIIGALQKKKLKEKEKEEEAQLAATTSENMIAMINKALSKQKITPEFSQTIQIVAKNEVIASKNFRGYSKSNVQSIDIMTKKS
ncbi:MAG: pentapeptide repeat-containing protein [Lachnospiraceae bacterium]|nr:pentapeptide repeat-containing protein [Lachnospiraceae bacterium]